MKIILNGSEMDFGTKATLLDIIEEKGLTPSRIVVEYNKEIIPVEKFGGIFISENDCIEIVSFVGGG